MHFLYEERYFYARKVYFRLSHQALKTTTREVEKAFQGSRDFNQSFALLSNLLKVLLTDA